jgi:tetratricopeptide (TPR) repeat protein
MSGNRVILAFICVFFSCPLSANWEAPPAEAAFLPKYCKVSSEIQREKIYGPGFQHAHHYCAALVALIRAARTIDPNERQVILSPVLGDLEYVIKNSPKNFVLLPEVLVKRGDVLTDFKRGAEAARDYYQAIQLKPDYAPAYSRLSDFYKRNGKIDEAKKVLNVGIKAAPKSKILQKKLSQLK